MAQSAVLGYRTSRQAMDFAGIHGTGSLVDAPARNDTVSCDLGQRHQDESTLEQTGVRQCQIRFIQCEVVIGKDIDISGARAVALFVRAVAAEPELYLLRARQ